MKTGVCSVTPLPPGVCNRKGYLSVSATKKDSILSFFAGAPEVADLLRAPLDGSTQIAVMYDCDDRYIGVNRACLGVLRLALGCLGRAR